MRPGLLRPNEQQRYWESILVNPRASDGVKEYAKRKITEQETYRKEHQAAQENDYVFRARESHGGAQGLRKVGA